MGQATTSEEIATKIDLYKAIPAQVIEMNSSCMETISPISIEADTNPTSTSDDSDTIKIQNFEKQHNTDTAVASAVVATAQKEQEPGDGIDSKERPSSLAISKSENDGNIVTPTRGSTPVAFKFLQPKRKLLEPNQVLTLDEEEAPASSSLEKPVIEAEVVKALPSVKALAKAFLMTTNKTQPEKLWLRKARTLSQGGKKRPTSPKRSLDQPIYSEFLKPEDDVTITSDLSSLETDSSSDLTLPTNDPSSPTVEDNTSPVTVRQGVLKNNIAFFENLKKK